VTFTVIPSQQAFVMAMKSEKFWTEGNAMICLPADILDHRRELVEALRGLNAPPSQYLLYLRMVFFG